MQFLVLTGVPFRPGPEWRTLLHINLKWSWFSSSPSSSLCDSINVPYNKIQWPCSFRQWLLLEINLGKPQIYSVIPRQHLNCGKVYVQLNNNFCIHSFFYLLLVCLMSLSRRWSPSVGFIRRDSMGQHCHERYKFHSSSCLWSVSMKGLYYYYTKWRRRWWRWCPWGVLGTIWNMRGSTIIILGVEDFHCNSLLLINM